MQLSGIIACIAQVECHNQLVPGIDCHLGVIGNLETVIKRTHQSGFGLGCHMLLDALPGPFLHSPLLRKSARVLYVRHAVYQSHHFYVAPPHFPARSCDSSALHSGNRTHTALTNPQVHMADVYCLLQWLS